MAETVTIEDPGKVIDALTSRIAQLERQLEFHVDQNRQAGPEQFEALLGWLRLRGVIPLYLGDMNYDVLKEKDFIGDEYVSNKYALRDLNQVWFLENAPISQEVKNVIREAANFGMNRF